ncbi:hypothetical protein PAHAL_9G267400 [Panicum hallii]|uniref:Uncharacterized protein n=1 Tax=Panicum hallii TaxID=206008 RepID=A0A2T8I2N6_9POAL|nr:hypothetical protein PAHAL_9G267400 [Panicum hallii]
MTTSHRDEQSCRWRHAGRILLHREEPGTTGPPTTFTKTSRGAQKLQRLRAALRQELGASRGWRPSRLGAAGDPPELRPRQSSTSSSASHPSCGPAPSSASRPSCGPAPSSTSRLRLPARTPRRAPRLQPELCAELRPRDEVHPSSANAPNSAPAPLKLRQSAPQHHGEKRRRSGTARFARSRGIEPSRILEGIFVLECSIPALVNHTQKHRMERLSILLNQTLTRCTDVRMRNHAEVVYAEK